MDELSDDMLMDLAEFRNVLHLSPSAERKKRGEEQDWPPHLLVGRRVFYFRDGVKDFLQRRRADRAGGGPELFIAAEARGGETIHWATAFTDDQKRWLREVLGRLDCGVVDLDTPKRGQS